jgi:hypothetical protein
VLVAALAPPLPLLADVLAPPLAEVPPLPVPWGAGISLLQVIASAATMQSADGAIQRREARGFAPVENLMLGSPQFKRREDTKGE